MKCVASRLCNLIRTYRSGDRQTNAYEAYVKGYVLLPRGKEILREKPARSTNSFTRNPTQIDLVFRVELRGK